MTGPLSGSAEISLSPPPLPRSLHPAGVQWSHALPAATLAGLLAALLMLTPLGGFGIGILAAGVLVVALYRRNSPGTGPTPALGAKLGLLSGSIGFAFFAVFMVVQVAVLHTGGELRAALVHAVEQAAARNPDPQAQAVANWLKSPDGLTLMMVLTLFFTFILFLIFSSLGGVLAAVWLRNRRKNN